jgi:hypothetical protein
MADIETTSIDELEVSVRCASELGRLGVKTVGELLALDPTQLPPRVAEELQFLLEEDFGLEWGEPVEPPPYEPPTDARVPRQTITLGEPDTSIDRASVDRVGGLPVVPAGFAWPRASGGTPMAFVFQIRGKAGGGDVDLGAKTMLQMFANLEGEYYEEGEHVVVAHAEPCSEVLEAPEGAAVEPSRAISFSDDFDDAILEDLEFDPDTDEDGRYDDAHSHAFCDKVRGLPVVANLELPVVGADGASLGLVVQWLSIDDWFAWHVFANEDLSELRAEIVRA